MKLLRIFTLILLNLLHLSAWAQSVEVSLFDGTTLDCSASTSLPAACVDPNGTRYFVQADERSAGAISLSTDGSFKTMLMLKQVKLDDQVIFEGSNFSGMGFPGMATASDQTRPMDPPPMSRAPRSTFRSDYMNSTGALSFLNFNTTNVTDPAALQLSEEMRALAQSKLDEASVNAFPQKIEIEFGPDKSTCEVIAPKNESVSCSIYRCKEPQNGFYIDNQYGLASIISLSADQKIQSEKEVDVVWNTLNRDKPVFEKLPFNAFMNGAGAYGPSPQLAQQAQRQRPNFGSQQTQLPSSFNNPMYRSNLSYLMDNCNEEAIAPLAKGVNDIRQKIADAQMVQLVEVSNNILSSRFINPNAIPGNACRDGDTWYRGQSYNLSQDLLTNSSPKTIDMETARRLFNEARAMSDISWGYKMDGCYARAHIMARRFEEQGIHVDKVWIKGDLRIPEAGVSWNYHVAPIVYVEDENGNVKKMVIDPSIMDAPVPVSEWSAKMEKGVVGDTVETQFPFPENAMFLERTAIAFSNSEPYRPFDHINMSEEEKMRQAKDTMVRYLGFLQ